MNILLVEDNPGDVSVIRRMFAEAQGVQVHLECADDLASGLARLTAGATDMVLLDLGLPDSQGLESLAAVRARSPEVPLIVLTGLDDECLAVEALRAGAQDYLVKGQLDAGLLVRSIRYAAERKRLEVELRERQEQLRESQRMEAIGRLAGGVAHDFNNLLTIITGRAQLVLDRLGPDEPARRSLELIRKTAERAASLTRQLLAFGRKQVLQPQVVSLNAVVANISGMLRRLIGEDIELATVLESGLGRVKVDPAQIEQIILNLALNARDAMPQGGRLTIETASVELDGAFVRRNPGARPGSHVVLAVSDTGCGMDAETRGRVFEPFFTTKKWGKGTGLGLSTVYGIVAQHEGYIAVESEPGRGATFSIYLPRVEGAAEVEVPRAVSGALRGSETVLLVEDEEGVRTLTREILETQGYTVLDAADGREALLVGERYTRPIHLMVTDVVMPEMSGRDLAAWIGRLRPEMKVLYISGYTRDAIGNHGVLDPDTNLLQKPFVPEALARKIREILDAPREGSPCADAPYARLKDVAKVLPLPFAPDERALTEDARRRAS